MTSATPKPQNSGATAQDPRWLRICSRDKTADGEFWYSVRTSRVYCRPSCASRTAQPANVTLHETLQSAKGTGFRPCKRCKPDGPSSEEVNAALVERACRLIEESQPAPALANLAKTLGLSASHFHRIFKAATGLTPKGYIFAHRAKLVRDRLSASPSVTHAIYDAGFNSSGRFYEKVHDMLGMTPRRFRFGGMDEQIRYAIGQSSLGAVLVASSAKGVVSVSLGDDPAKLTKDLRNRFPRARMVKADSVYGALVSHVIGLVEAPNLGANLPLDIRGTAFQQRVWRTLRRVPPGQTVTYSQVARKIGKPKATRAVAQACAANNLAVVIPCHRVVRSDGSPSGYAWGSERKRTLLDLEVRHTALPFRPAVRPTKRVATHSS